jgi:hypothetical protein
MRRLLHANGKRLLLTSRPAVILLKQSLVKSCSIFHRSAIIICACVIPTCVKALVKYAGIFSHATQHKLKWIKVNLLIYFRLSFGAADKKIFGVTYLG